VRFEAASKTLLRPSTASVACRSFMLLPASSWLLMASSSRWRVPGIDALEPAPAPRSVFHHRRILFELATDARDAALARLQIAERSKRRVGDRRLARLALPDGRLQCLARDPVSRHAAMVPAHSASVCHPRRAPTLAPWRAIASC